MNFQYHPKSLATKLPNQGERIYDDEGFRYTLLEHIANMSKGDNLTPIPIDQQTADMYFGDFYGLLLHIGVSPYLHWFVTRLNGLTDSMDYNSDSLYIYIPTESEMERLKILYMSTTT